MDIILSNSSGKPIYEQIADQVREQILSGALIGSKVSRKDVAALKKILLPTAILLLFMTLMNLTLGMSREKAASWPRRTGSCCGRPSCAGWRTSSPRPWMRPARAASPCRNCRNF